MKRELITRPRADIDLLKHYLYLAEHSPRAAERFRSSVRAAANRIAAHPRGGATLTHPSFANVELRFVRPNGFPKYLLIYQVTDDCTFLLRILHGSQDFESELRPQ